VRVGAQAEGPVERLGLALGQVPTPLFETYVALMTARTIMAGASLGIFPALAEQPDDVEGLARRLDLDAAGVDVLVTALHSVGYLEERGGRFHPSKDVERWLLPSAAGSIADFATVFGYDMWDHFGSLEDTVRTGEPIGLHERPPDDPYWERYMRGLFALSRLGGDTVARMIPASSPHSLLDLAGGHGGYAIALCRRHPGLRATIVDLEGAARIGRRIVEEEGMADRIEYRVGDLFEADLGSEHDIVMANSIAHHFDAEQNVRMLRRAHEALRPGGTMAIQELERPPAGSRGSPLGTLTGLLFYITSRVRTYTADELAGFLAQAGFSGVRPRRHPRFPGNVVVLGRA
jgi:2-polyprenyl-3-methyl-5-hydroxy-6-metoxy-1,4-benzoquinol methylase